MRGPALDRRRFLAAAIAIGGTLFERLGPFGLGLSQAWAQGTLNAEARRTFTDLARRLYPHQSLADSVYTEVLDDALHAAATDPALEEAFASAEKALDSQQTVPFADLEAKGQIAALRAIWPSAELTAIQSAIRVRLYKHPAVWAMLGYEGPSWQLGGYLGRGAGEIDWLPKQD